MVNLSSSSVPQSWVGRIIRHYPILYYTRAIHPLAKLTIYLSHIIAGAPGGRWRIVSEYLSDKMTRTGDGSWTRMGIRTASPWDNYNNIIVLYVIIICIESFGGIVIAYVQYESDESSLIYGRWCPSVCRITFIIILFWWVLVYNMYIRYYYTGTYMRARVSVCVCV